MEFRGPSLGQFAKSWLALVVARATGILLSLAISVLLANRLGASTETDAYFLVRRLTAGLTETLRRMVLRVTVPPLVAALRSPDGGVTGRPWRSHVIRTLGVALFAAAMVALLAPWVVAVFAPGFDPGRAALATHLLRVLVFLIPAGLVLAGMTSLLYATRQFGLPEFASALPRFLGVIMLLLLVPPLGVTALVWTLVGGTALAVLVLIPRARSVVRSTKNEKGEVPITTAPVGPDMTVAEGPGLDLQGRTLPVVLMLGASQAAAWIDFVFASTLVVGGVSVLEYGQRIVQMLPVVLTGTLISVMYTEFAHKAAEGGGQGLERSVVGCLRAGLFLLLPLLAFLGVAAGPIVRLLFQHGAFSAEAAELTASVVRLYAPAVVLTFLRNTLMFGLFAERSGSHVLQIAAAVACIVVLSRVGFVALLVAPLGVLGIALAASLSAGLASFAAYVFLTRHWGKFLDATDIRALAQMLVATAVSAGTMYGLLRLTGGAATGGTASAIVALAAVGAGGAVSYLGVARLFRMKEISVVRGLLRRTPSSRSA